MVSRAPRRDLLPPDDLYLAETRTLLALLRTGFAVAGGGAVASQFLLARWPDWVTVLMTLPFVAIGYAMSWSAVNRHRQLRKRARLAGRELHQPSWLYVPLTITLQVVIVAVLVLYIVRR